MKPYLFFPWLLVLILLMENRQQERRLKACMQNTALQPAAETAARKRNIPARIVFIRRLIGNTIRKHHTSREKCPG